MSVLFLNSKLCHFYRYENQKLTLYYCYSIITVGLVGNCGTEVCFGVQYSMWLKCRYLQNIYTNPITSMNEVVFLGVERDYNLLITE